MNSYYKTFFAASAGVTLSLLLSLSALAQGPADLKAATPATSAVDATASPDAAALPDAPPPPTQDPTGSGASDGWRGQIAIYGWFPGIHGTVGALGHDASIHVPFSDVWHTLKGIIPIAVEADKGRFVMPVDFFWVKLGDDKGIPFNELGQTSVNIHLTESIFTPKVGYRLFDGEHLKIDALGGIRYWHVGLNLAVEPSGIGRSQSANWVDGLGRRQVHTAPRRKGGHHGGGRRWRRRSEPGLPGRGPAELQLHPPLGRGGWLAIFVCELSSEQSSVRLQPHQTGLVAGVSYNFGGAPPVPVSASCSVSPTEIWSGDPVTATVSTQ